MEWHDAWDLFEINMWQDEGCGEGTYQDDP